MTASSNKCRDRDVQCNSTKLLKGYQTLRRVFAACVGDLLACRILNYENDAVLVGSGAQMLLELVRWENTAESRFSLACTNAFKGFPDYTCSPLRVFVTARRPSKFSPFQNNYNYHLRHLCLPDGSQTGLPTQCNALWAVCGLEQHLMDTLGHDAPSLSGLLVPLLLYANHLTIMSTTPAGLQRQINALNFSASNGMRSSLSI